MGLEELKTREAGGLGALFPCGSSSELPLHPHVTVGYVQLDYKHGCVQVCSTPGAVGSLAVSLEATCE